MDHAAAVLAMTLSKSLTAARSLPKGARFFRCALQINPHAYLQRHARPTRFANEADYNDAVIRECKTLGIEVIAVTDHYRVEESAALMTAARSAGIHVFGGFEAVSKDGVHFLCLFEHDRDTRALERIIGECGVHDSSAESPTGSVDSDELLRRCAERWDGICIAAHVASNDGLLKKLSGQSRAKVWKSDHLKAVALAGTKRHRS